jgi:alanyl-tRNA synthetase
LSSKVNASDIARELSLFLGGTGGGGKPTLAQSGGIDNGMLPKLQDKIKELLVR